MEVILFFIRWLVCYCLVMFAMSVDNICWISASPEYELFKKLNWFNPHSWFEPYDCITVKGRDYYTKMDYIINYRIREVLTHIRDIIPAIFTSLIMSLIGGLLWKS